MLYHYARGGLFDVSGSSFVIPGGGADAPIGHFRSALLATALTLTTAFLPFLTLYLPPPNHRVAIDIRPGPGHDARDEPYHLLEVSAHGRTTLDGREAAGLVALRMRLDYIAAHPQSGIELRADPNARYENFLEILTLLKRANVRHLRIVGEGWSAPEAQGWIRE